MTETTSHPSRPVTRADVELLLLLDALDAGDGDTTTVASHLGLSNALTPALRRAALRTVALGLCEEEDDRVRLNQSGAERLMVWKAAVR